MRVLSLDISASSTGWAFGFGKVKVPVQHGIIKTSPKSSRPERLNYFKHELEKLLLKLKPSHVVMEDVYSGLNAKTLVLLAKFAGVAEECCYSITGIEPYIIHTSTVKAYFKAKKKEDVFDAISDIFEWDPDKFSFKKHNDVSDAIGQLLCYLDHVLNYRKFRAEKEYGYLYEV